MATSQQFLVCDSSTLANFKAWAQALSNQIRTFGFTNTSDTGQLNGAGGNNWAGVAAVPGSAAYFYEIFQSNDGLTTFYVKVEYGNNTGTNSPYVRVSVGTGTNGAGTLSGFVIGPNSLPTTVNTPTSTTTTFECDFSGDAGRLCILMWRNSTLGAQMFAIQRTLDATGAATATGVTLWVASIIGAGSRGTYQATIKFGVGAAPNNFGTASATLNGWQCSLLNNGANSAAFDGVIPLDLAQPLYGRVDYVSTAVGIGLAADFAEGVSFSITVYGASRTYMPTKTGIYLGNTAFALLMEYD